MRQGRLIKFRSCHQDTVHQGHYATGQSSPSLGSITSRLDYTRENLIRQQTSPVLLFGFFWLLSASTPEKDDTPHRASKPLRDRTVTGLSATPLGTLTSPHGDAPSSASPLYGVPLRFPGGAFDIHNITATISAPPVGRCLCGWTRARGPSPRMPRQSSRLSRDYPANSGHLTRPEAATGSDGCHEWQPCPAILVYKIYQESSWQTSKRSRRSAQRVS